MKEFLLSLHSDPCSHRPFLAGEQRHMLPATPDFKETNHAHCWTEKGQRNEKRLYSLCVFIDHLATTASTMLLSEKMSEKMSWKMLLEDAFG